MAAKGGGKPPMTPEMKLAIYARIKTREERDETYMDIAHELGINIGRLSEIKQMFEGRQLS